MAGDGILDQIGGTPLVRLRHVVPEGGAEIWIKLEYVNPTGSMKDRLALAMVEGAQADGLVPAGTTSSSTRAAAPGRLAGVRLPREGLRRQDRDRRTLLQADLLGERSAATSR